MTTESALPHPLATAQYSSKRIAKVFLTLFVDGDGNQTCVGACRLETKVPTGSHENRYRVSGLRFGQRGVLSRGRSRRSSGPP